MTKLSTLYKFVLARVGSDTFNTLVVTCALFFVGFTSYLLQFVLGRLLSVESFGDFNGLLSLVTVISFIATVVGMALVKVFSELYGDKSYGMLRNVFRKVIAIALGVGIAVGIVLILSGTYIKAIFNITSQDIILFYALSFSISLTTMFFGTLLQGINKFVFFSLYLVQGSISRFLITTLLVYFIRRDPGMVYLGFFFSHLLSLLVGIYLYKLANIKAYAGDQHYTKGASTAQFKKLIIDSVPIAIITGVMTLLANTDLILVKSLFSPYEAGIYAGTVTLGKVILFGSGSVATVMYPRVVSVRKSKEQLLLLVRQFTIIQVVLVLLPLLLYVLFPKLIAGLLFGAKYYPTVPYLPMYAFFVSCWVFVNFMLTLFIALDARKVAFLVPVFALLQYVGIYLFHGTLAQVLQVNIVVGLAFLVFTLGAFVLRVRKIAT